MIRCISLGAGVQSTTMALLARHGVITPMPDCAIFADTGWEPKAVYAHLDYLETLLPFPVYRVSAGNLRDDIISKATGRFAAVPFFTGSGMGRRQCTKEYKLYPIRRHVRQQLGGKTPKAGCEMWIGVSTDEAHRMKQSTVQYIENRWPLIELRMNRGDCKAWLAKHDYPIPPKSSCIGCPYHSDEQWLGLTPDEFADAVHVDDLIRNGGTQMGVRSQQYMHRSCVPLDQVDFSRSDPKRQPDLFGNECEGMCGV